MERCTYAKLIFPLITARSKIIGKPSTLIAGRTVPEESANEVLARGSLVRRGGRSRALSPGALGAPPTAEGGPAALRLPAAIKEMFRFLSEPFFRP